MNTIPLNLLPSLVLGALVGLAAGYLGSLMILRRMALVGDALSHVALPGLALGLIFHFNPFWGAFGALVIAVLLIWAIENKTQLATETLVGVFFTLSLAIGLLLTPEPELLEALFGDISQVQWPETISAGLLSLLAIVASWWLYRPLILATISKDLARSTGLNTARTDLLFLFLVALVVALGIKMIGTLLMGALVIIPAATAKNWSGHLRAYARGSSALGLLSAVLGIYLASVMSWPPGPIVVLTGCFFFFLSLAGKKREIN